MKIKVSKGELYLKLEEASAGLLDTSSRESAVEYGEVIDVGEDVTEYKKGDVVFVKSWALDHIDYKGKRHYFVSLKTGGVKAIVK